MKKKIIDLSLTYKKGMQTYHKKYHKKFILRRTAEFNNTKRRVSEIRMGTHTGTHLDAPSHFLKNGKNIEKLETEHFYGEAEILDFSKYKKKTKIELSDVLKKIKYPDLKILIFRFDWTDRFYGKNNFYYEHPYLSEKICKWMVKKGYKLLGLDSPQPDNPMNTNKKLDGINHKILLKNNIFIVEYLTNLKKVNSKKILFCSFPIKIQGADGAPCRSVAIL